MNKTDLQYTPIEGSDYPGMEIVAIAELRLTNRYLSEVPLDVQMLSIPVATKGKVDEITAASYKLNLLHRERASGEQKELVFWMRRREFDLYFTKLL